MKVAKIYDDFRDKLNEICKAFFNREELNLDLILFLCLSACFFSLFVVRFYFWYHFDQRIAVVTERVDAVAERMDAVDEGVKRNSQVKEVCKSKQSFYCRGSRVAEIDQ